MVEQKLVPFMTVVGSFSFVDSCYVTYKANSQYKTNSYHSDHYVAKAKLLDVVKKLSGPGYRDFCRKNRDLGNQFSYEHIEIFARKE